MGMDAGEIILFDLVPGPVNWGALPTANANGNAFGGSVHNSSELGYPIGHKIGYYDATNNGPSILAYLKYSAGDVTLDLGDLCMVDTSGTTAADWFKVTNDGDDAIIGSYPAIAISAMTDAYYGWFWVGGVAPVVHVTGFASGDASIHTDGNIADESILEPFDLTSPDQVGFKPAATTFHGVGIAFAADD